MNMDFKSILERARRILLLTAPLVLLQPVTALAALDLLKVPALQSSLAAKGMLLGIATAGERRLVAVGERGIIVYSDDNGARWKQAAVPVSVSLTAVRFASKDQGWAVGHDGVILHSRDGGETWEKQFDGNDANALVIAELEARLKATQDAADKAAGKAKEAANEALEATRNALEDVKAGAEFGPGRPLLGLWFRDENEGLAVGAFGQVFHTADGGKHWESWGGRINNPEGLHYNAIIQLPDGALLIIGEAGKLRRSRDGGARWETLDTGYSGHFYGAVAVPESKVLLAFGFAGNIYRSEDDGKSWQAVERLTRKPLIGGLRLADGTLLLVDSDRRQLTSRDNGKTFSIGAAQTGRAVAALLPVLVQGQLAVCGTGGATLLKPNSAGN